jgi:hypothetical protein
MLNWIQDDLGYFANQGDRQASVWGVGRYWRWSIFVKGEKVASARSRSLDEAKDNAAIMLRRFV